MIQNTSLSTGHLDSMHVYNSLRGCCLPLYIIEGIHLAKESKIGWIQDDQRWEEHPTKTNQQGHLRPSLLGDLEVTGNLGFRYRVIWKPHATAVCSAAAETSRSLSLDADKDFILPSLSFQGLLLWQTHAVEPLDFSVSLPQSDLPVNFTLGWVMSLLTYAQGVDMVGENSTTRPPGWTLNSQTQTFKQADSTNLLYVFHFFSTFPDAHSMSSPLCGTSHNLFSVSFSGWWPDLVLHQQIRSHLVRTHISSQVHVSKTPCLELIVPFLSDSLCIRTPSLYVCSVFNPLLPSQKTLCLFAPICLALISPSHGSFPSVLDTLWVFVLYIKT